MKIWEVASPIPAYRQERPVQDITCAREGRRLAVDDQLWEIVSGAGPVHLRPLATPVPADHLAFSRSGGLYAWRRQRDWFKDFDRPTTLWQLEPTRRELALSTLERSEQAKTAGDVRQTAFSPDGRVAALYWERQASNGKQIMHAGKWIDLWDLAAPRRLSVVFDDTWDASFHPDGSSSTKSRPRGPGSYGEDPRQFVFNGDGRTLVISYNTGVVVYDIPSGKPVRWLANAISPEPSHTRFLPTHCVAFSPDGRWICYGGAEGRLNIGATESASNEPPIVSIPHPPGDTLPKLGALEPSVSWKGHEGSVLALAVSPDGRSFVSGGEDRMIRLWELPTGRALASWEAHDASVTALAYRPDGQMLISGAADALLRLWDLPSIRRELDAIGLDW